MFTFFSTAVLLCVLSVTVQGQIAQYIANNVKVEYTVINNLDKDSYGQFSGEIKLSNQGSVDINDANWEIYFCSVRLMEQQVLGNFSISHNGAELGDSRVKVFHINGCMHKLKPNGDFQGIARGQTLNLPFKAALWTVQRTDAMPRWFVTSPSEDAYVIASTAGESLDFVSDFTTKEQWKRSDLDLYNPLTPQDRFENYGVMGGKVADVLPTPKELNLQDNMYVDIMTGDWQVVYYDSQLEKNAQYLADKLKKEVVHLSGGMELPDFRYILLNYGNIADNGEGYHVTISSENSMVNITGTDNPGVFYGIQTLLSLSSSSMDGSVKAGTITDHPRFAYRGMHLDTSRHFFSKETVLELIDVMATYKLNKFHFHLTDDEGWRLEIPGLNEATEVGARQCFDLNETQCVIPQLGSGPRSTDSGSGFYTVDEYKEILQYADDRHIEVIPEFDMPGHSHAIIKAMEARAKKLNNDSFLLSDAGDTSEYLSVQYFTDNALNPCMDSTYTFVRYLIQQVKMIHESIQPLRVFNFGGDEVAIGSWEKSPVCQQLIRDSIDIDIHNETTVRIELQKYFAIRLAEIVAQENLDLAGWEDGLGDEEHPFNRSLISPSGRDVFMYAWNNIWEWHGGERAYNFANEGYKVIVGHGTHLYFDHPQEPDPEARGFYWATRYTDSKKTFQFDAQDVYNNIDVDLNGNKIDKDAFCEPPNRCVPLSADSVDNIIGIQGHLWSETVRTTGQLHSMIFPRLLAMAERAWHRADWEGMTTIDTNARDMDWAVFATTLGQKELARLDEMGIQYYVPAPGAKLSSDGTLEANAMFPGLQVEYSTDNQNTWSEYKQGVKISAGNGMLYLRTRSASGGRYSRTVGVDSSGIEPPNTSSAYRVLSTATTYISILFMMYTSCQAA